jgi:hypothetical protein
MTPSVVLFSVTAGIHPGRRSMDQHRFKILAGLSGLKSLLSNADLGRLEFTALMVFGLGLTAVWISFLAYGLFSLIFWVF